MFRFQKISSTITKERILHKLNIMVKSLKRDSVFENQGSHCFVLNPHAGDQGVIGNEDQKL
ncbi:MAG: 4-hydroxythreonine-4-phosphate dehydrogenase PdxA [Bacteroidetes bacterium]|nr:4-hydroxythreonine-4-phosphate dehydrogenase PdxA [Bacteroidota bacterium]